MLALVNFKIEMGIYTSFFALTEAFKATKMRQSKREPSNMNFFRPKRPHRKQKVAKPNSLGYSNFILEIEK